MTDPDEAAGTDATVPGGADAPGTAPARRDSDDRVTPERVEFLLVRIADDRYAIELGHLRRITDTPSVTRVPRTPELVRGVASIDGEIAAVVDGGTAFDHSAVSTEGSQLVVLERQDDRLGLLVDAIETFELVDVAAISLTTDDELVCAQIAELPDDTDPDTASDGSRPHAPKQGLSEADDAIAVVAIDALFEAATP